MTATVKNIFGVAAAIIVLLGLNVITDKIDFGTTTAAEKPSLTYNTTENPAENRAVYSLKDLNNELVEIAENANPSVVTITTEKTEQVRMFNPFSQFFGFPDGGNGVREFTQQGLGSGVIIAEEGYILTNNHVIDGVDKIKIRLFSGDEVDAKIVGTDPQTDLAVLKVEGENMPAIKLGNSDNLKVGAFVLAIGSPLNPQLAHTVSFGIVSAKGRSLNTLTEYGNYIQTDAAINPGNSGGALIDMNGELVGINSAIASRSGGNDGIGFAIPINLAKRVMEDLIEDGEVSRGYLGITFGAEVDKTMAKALGVDVTHGIIVGQVEEGGPADKAGLKDQDVLVSLNGEEIKNWDTFRYNIAAFKPGDKVKLGIIRDNKSREITVTLGRRDAEQLASAGTNENAKNMSAALGFSVAELNAAVRQQRGIEADVEGVLVYNLNRSSNAYRRGLRDGDIIVKVKNKDIDSVSDFRKAMDEVVKSKDEVVLLSVHRNGIQQYIAFEL